MGLRVGLSGGIASGKSTVSGLFAQLGITVIDADLIAREVVMPGTPGLAGLIELFDQSILQDDGHLDRNRLRNIIFSDPAHKDRVNQLLHPLIGEEMLRRSNTAPGPYHVLDIPLLVEGQWRTRVDRIVIVDCSEEQQIERVMARDNETREGALRIIRAQTRRVERLEAADDIIDNSGLPEALVPQVYQLHRCYLEAALAKNTDRNTDKTPD